MTSDEFYNEIVRVCDNELCTSCKFFTDTGCLFHGRPCDWDLNFIYDALRKKVQMEILNLLFDEKTLHKKVKLNIFEKMYLRHKRPKCPWNYRCQDCIHFESIWRNNIFYGINCRINAR